MVAKAKLTSTPTQTSTKVSYKKRKTGTMPVAKIEPRGRKLRTKKRRVIFQKESGAPQKSEEDFMFVLNKLLQKTDAPAYIRFCQVGYAQSGAISALLQEKTSIKDLVKEHSNILIEAAKFIDEVVIGMEALEP